MEKIFWVGEKVERNRESTQTKKIGVKMCGNWNGQSPCAQLSRHGIRSNGGATDGREGWASRNVCSNMHLDAAFACSAIFSFMRPRIASIIGALSISSVKNITNDANHSVGHVLQSDERK
jgi:hypothetical protein